VGEGSADRVRNETLSATMVSFSFQRSNLPDAVSRALGNVGRVYARIGKFQQAIDTYVKSGSEEA